LEILGTAPRLRKLLCSEDAGPCTFLIPYEGLSTVTCESLSPDDLFDLLLCAPSLEDFTDCVRDDEIARLGTITHERLQTPMATIYISSDFFAYPPSKIFILQRLSALKSVPFFFRSSLAHPPCDASPRVSTTFHWPPTGSPLPCRTSRTSSCVTRHRSSYSIRIDCSSHLYKTLLCGIVLWMWMWMRLCYKHFDRDVSRAKTRLFSDRFGSVRCRTTPIHNPLHCGRSSKEEWRFLREDVGFEPG
jgi:hypothetical protein